MMDVTDQELDRFPETVVAGNAELSEARRSFADWLTALGVATGRIEDLLVVFSELVSNAVRETPDGAEPATVCAAADEAAVRLEVTNVVDDGHGGSIDHDWDLDDPLRSGGRGLVLVSAFVDDVDVDVTEDRLVLRCLASR
ncbi:MAG: ATP-binding protein [Acidimicrobiales bacterium]|nr:ATP-binding protein [Acidimicrobiales bacterium]